MITLFVVSGVVQYLGDADQVIQLDDFRGRRNRYVAYCSEHGIEPLPIVT